MDKKILLKRVVAYILDFMIVYVVAFALANSKINPQYPEYKKSYDNYYNSPVYDVYVDYTSALIKSYDDEKIADDEYSTLIENYPKYNEELSNKYEDKKITKNEYDELIALADSKYIKEYKPGFYNKEHDSLFYNITLIVLIILYFGIFPIFTNGQTFGKKIFNLRVVKNDGSKATVINYLLRTIILFNVVFTIISCIFVNVLSVNSFYTLEYIVSLLKSVVEWSILLMIFVRKDNRGLHDIIGNTRIIFDNGILNETVTTTTEINDVSKKESTKTIVEVIPKANKTNKKEIKVKD